MPARARPAGQLDLFAPTDRPRSTYWHCGLGADSTAGLDMVLDDPTAFRLAPDLSDLTVVVAHTGNEWPDTLALTEQHILPRLREHRVRLVEIARGGPHDADGIAVLSDTRDPRTLHRRGPWTLADELDTTGTVPMRAKGHRRCSLKFKGWVLDTWEAAETQGRPYRVAVGYNAEEVSRALGDVAASVPARRPWYPLIARKLARIDVEEHLHAQYGVLWPKSYCTFCPFPSMAAAREQHLARMRAFPNAGAKSLMIEHVARALNPNSTLRATGSLLDEVLAAPGMGAVLDLYRRTLDETPTAVYEIRRLLPAARSKVCEHTKACAACRAAAPDRDTCPHSLAVCDTCRDPRRPGRSMRSLRTLSVGSLEAAREHLASLAAKHDAELAVDDAGFARATVIARTPKLYPTLEHLFVVAPAGPCDKERPGFAASWAAATGPTLL